MSHWIDPVPEESFSDVSIPVILDFVVSPSRQASSDSRPPKTNKRIKCCTVFQKRKCYPFIISMEISLYNCFRCKSMIDGFFVTKRLKLKESEIEIFTKGLTMKLCIASLTTYMSSFCLDFMYDFNLHNIILEG